MMISEEVRDKLGSLLDESANFSLEARGTSNHCPMVLVALATMGATSERLQTHFDRWIEEYAIKEVSPRISIAPETWRAFTGVAHAFGSLQAYFSQWIISSGASTVLEAILRQVPFAPATGAFHALIRIAYGIESANANEIAAGLAAYVATNLSCRIDFAGRNTLASAKEGFTLLSDRFGNASWEGRSITDRLRSVAATQEFRDELRLPPMGPDFIDAMARAAIDLYWQTADFTALHMVTGTHAARILLAQIPKDLADRFYPELWTAMAIAYVSLGAPAECSSTVNQDLLEWNELLARAIESEDDHVIKMVYTCHRDYLRDHNPLYRAAATRIVQRDHS